MGGGPGDPRPLTHRIRVSRSAVDDLRALDRPTRRVVAETIDSLRTDALRGKELRGILVGCRSVRTARDRHRVVYRIDEDEVAILAIGPRRPGDRRDVYAELARLLADTEER